MNLAYKSANYKKKHLLFKWNLNNIVVVVKVNYSASVKINYYLNLENQYIFKRA